MDSECVISQELGNRISKLESQNRRLRQIGAATLVVLTLLVIMGEASSRKTVEANEFVLRDGNGNVRARLSMNESLSAPEMVLLDEKGRNTSKSRRRQWVIVRRGGKRFRFARESARAHFGTRVWRAYLVARLNRSSKDHDFPG
jgi:hypothetical protein